MSTTQKYSSSPYSNNSNCSNILQPKRLNGVSTATGETGGLIVPRRILGQKGQLPVSQLSNQQLTTLLKNSPLLPPLEGFNSGTTGGESGGGHISHSTAPKRAPTTMAKRNARERNRVKQVNQGFQTLRQHIPESYRMKKMSKVDTLRCALDYIRNMKRVLQDDEFNDVGSSTMMLPLRSGDSVSPSSTSISFSSEDDDYLVAAFSGDFTSTSHASSPLGDQTELQNKSDLFGSSRLVLSSSSSSPPTGYNDENNDENLHLDVKLEQDQERAHCYEQQGICVSNPLIVMVGQDPTADLDETDNRV